MDVKSFMSSVTFSLKIFKFSLLFLLWIISKLFINVLFRVCSYFQILGGFIHLLLLFSILIHFHQKTYCMISILWNCHLVLIWPILVNVQEYLKRLYILLLLFIYICQLCQIYRLTHFCCLIMSITETGLLKSSNIVVAVD